MKCSHPDDTTTDAQRPPISRGKLDLVPSETGLRKHAEEIGIIPRSSEPLTIGLLPQTLLKNSEDENVLKEMQNFIAMGRKV